MTLSEKIMYAKLKHWDDVVKVKDLKESLKELMDSCDGNGFVHDNKIREIFGEGLLK
ncbi:MAG: hypothetical protein ACFFG0_02850 [Candidatus Thorarchaeota archaeon]